MKYVGVDLHKHSITVCVMSQAGNRREVLDQRRFPTSDTESIRAFLARQGEFEVVVEATTGYEWFLELARPLAARAVLAHPRKLRVIAETKRKTDKLDARTLAEFLALGLIPEAYRPTAREREHRVLVRHRHYLQKRITGVKNKVRHLLAVHNADLKNPFSRAGQAQLAELKLPAADRFAIEQLLDEFAHHRRQLRQMDQRLAEFAESAPLAEREAREILESVPNVGPVTVDVVLSEVGDVRRFRSIKRLASYAGLAPGIRQSAGKKHQLGITKEGSRLLRWAMVQMAWRMVGKSRRWGLDYLRLKQRMGAKKAIVAIARRLLCMIGSMLRSGQKYKLAREEARVILARARLRREPRRERQSRPRSSIARGSAGRLTTA
jgi:transposase